LNKSFIRFVKENKNHTLTAIIDHKAPWFYTFKEDSTWLFDEDSLIVIE